MSSSRQIIVALISTVLCLMLVSCAGHNPAPISGDRKSPPTKRIKVYRVEKGDTLFSIAWRYEKDLYKLAAANGIRPPYTIYVGQKLSLDTRRVSSRQAKAIQKPVAKKPTPVKKSSQPKPPPAKPTASKPVAKASKPKATSKPAPVKKPVALPSHVKWTWPVKGRVIRQFGSDKLFKGIDVSALPGAPVYSAAKGVVVYSGDGLRGYGRLIIIKHSEVYISAYAHNRKVLVKEGQLVEAKTKIAEVGGDPANVRRFYFEIRKDGKPVNPLNYLP